MKKEILTLENIKTDLRLFKSDNYKILIGAIILTPCFWRVVMLS